ncbi:(Fe-S)-binding protein [Chloroflexota bacterium]
MNNPDILIGNYTMELIERACEPGSFEYKIELTLPNDVSEALPYINAATDSIDYLHNEKFLSFHHKDTFCSMRPNLITIAMAHSREEVLEMIDVIVSVINDIWSKRDDIEPKYTGRKAKPPTLSVYKLLPRTNCRECGLATCMAFASALINNQAQLDKCPCLLQNEFLQNKTEITKLLAG